jgi:hypothetical protein
MYPSVPMSMPGSAAMAIDWVWALASDRPVRRARPKSRTFGPVSGSIATFADFKSRWMTPRSCACASAPAIWAP